MLSSLGVHPTLDMPEVVSRRRSHYQSEEVRGVDSRFADRTTKKHLEREGEAKLDCSRTGNANLVD